MKIPIGFFALPEKILNGNLLFCCGSARYQKCNIVGFGLSKTIEFRKKKGVISAIAL